MSPNDEPAPRAGGSFDFDAIYEQGAIMPEATGLPWDIGTVQPAVVEFEARGRFHGDVLDAGCGPGDNSIFLADRGYRVTGVDSAAAAVDQARARAGARDVTFAVADAVHLTGYEGRFDSVLSSMLFHSLDPALRLAHTAALHRATRPGARLSLLTFTGEYRGGLSTLAVPEDQLRTTLTGGGWRITDLDRTTFTVLAAPMREALRSSGVDPVADERGWTRAPVWRLEAVRE